MAAFSTIALVGAAALSAVGGLAAAQSQKETAEFNALQAERDAAAAEAESKEEARRIRHQGRRLRGEQVNQAAASGLTITGSILDILADDAMEIELQALDAERQGELSSIRGREEASLTRSIGKSQARQSILGGLTRAASFGFQASQSSGSSDTTKRTPPKPKRNPRR